MKQFILTKAIKEEVQKEDWNYKHLCYALIIGFVLQSFFLPCLCQIGEAKIMTAFVFDGLVVMRIIAAKLLEQKGKGWIFYAVLIYTSPLWIELASRIMIGH
ncbi:MAG: hypothetical protein GY795_41710 [Desulfobacterales bacterium]|nr:hypothetical protein [Desulfobacterales bacterium]